MNRITRTIETHTIYPATVNMVDGQLIIEELEPLVLNSVAYTEKRAMTAIRNVYGRTGNYVITKKETKRDVYAADVDKFMEIAKIVTDEEEEASEV